MIPKLASMRSVEDKCRILKMKLKVRDQQEKQVCTHKEGYIKKKGNNKPNKEKKKETLKEKKTHSVLDTVNT